MVDWSRLYAESLGLEFAGPVQMVDL
jgi:hypothetical protein